MKRLSVCIAFIFSSVCAFAQTGALQGFCTQGAVPAVTSGSSSANALQGVIAGCTVTVYLHGTTTLATIYKDANNTPLANPFTANLAGVTNAGGWLFYAATSQGVDIFGSGGGGNPACTTQPKCYAVSTSIAVAVYPSTAITVVTGVLTAQGTSPVEVNGASGTPASGAVTISLPVADTSDNGYLSLTDWNTFNGKQPALGLLKGTYVDGDLCGYTASGTLLNCNTAPGGTGTVTDGSGITIPLQFPESTSSAHVLQYRTPTQALGDMGAAAAVSCATVSSLAPTNGGCYNLSASSSVAMPAASTFSIFTVNTASGQTATFTGVTLTSDAGCSSYLSGTTLALTGNQSVVFKSDLTNIWASCTATGSGITALTGDVTAGPGTGSQAASVVKVNGLAVPASQPCVGTNSSSQFVAGSGCSAGTGLPTKAYTSSQTAVSADNGYLIVMNCSSCSYTLPVTQPASQWAVAIQFTGTGDTVALSGGATYNGGSSGPAVNQYSVIGPLVADQQTTTNYKGPTPITASTNIIVTPSQSGIAVAASGGSSLQWQRQGVVISPTFTDPSPQAQEPSAFWDSSPEVLSSSYHNVVKMAWTDGWSTTNGVGICFGESPDGITPPTRISAACPLASTSGYARSHMLPQRESGNIVLLATNFSTGSGDIFTGTTMAGLTKTSTGVIACGSNGSEVANSLGSWMTVNTSGNNWTMVYECLSHSNYSTWVATSTTGYAGTYTKVQTTPVIGDTGNTGPSGHCVDGSPDWFYYDGTHYWLTTHCGPSGSSPAPTPYIYLASSTDAITWTFQTAPLITAQTVDEGIGLSTGQLANSWILPDLATAYAGGNRTILYYAAYANGGCSTTCGSISYIKAATISSTLANILASGSSEGSALNGSPELLLGGKPTSSQRVAGYFALPPLSVADSGGGNLAIQSGAAISTFLGTSGTAISSYTDSSGSTYALYANSGTSPQSIPLLSGNGAASVAAGSTSTFGDVLTSYAPVTADYRASGTFAYNTGSTALAAVFVRANSAAATNYVFQCGPTAANCAVFKDVSGTPTQLGSSVPLSWSSGSVHTLSLQAVGTTITAWVDGVAVITATDSAISATGQAGFRVTGGSSFSITNFVVTGLSNGSGITQLTGDIAAGPGTGSQASTLATVNSSPGTCGDSTHVSQITVNGKGLTTACTAVAITASGSGAWTNITGSVTVSGCTVSGNTCNVSGSSTAAVTLSVIPGTYSALRIGVLGQDVSGSEIVVLTTFNGDTGNNYAISGTFQDATGSPSANQAHSIGDCGAMIVSSTGVSYGDFLLPGYANTSFIKDAIIQNAAMATTSGSTGNRTSQYSCGWNNTAAITSVTFTMASGDFAAGTSFEILGQN